MNSVRGLTEETDIINQYCIDNLCKILCLGNVGIDMGQNSIKLLPYVVDLRALGMGLLLFISFIL